MVGLQPSLFLHNPDLDGLGLAEYLASAIFSLPKSEGKVYIDTRFEVRGTFTVSAEFF